MTSNFSIQDRDLVSLIAQSLAPAPEAHVGAKNLWGDPDQIRKLHALDLPSRDWLHACVGLLVESAADLTQLAEGLDFLGADSDPIAEWSDAWICASVIDDGESISDWVDQRVSDPLYDRIIDNTGDYDFADTVLESLKAWGASLDLSKLGDQFVELARSGPRNSNGQTCEEVLKASGLLAELI